MGFVIAIDGPAASGKGTIGRQLAKHFGYHYLDTGLIYRAVAYLTMRRCNNSIKKEDAIEVARKFEPSALRLNYLRSHEVAINASKVAAISEVRDELIEFQRTFAKKSPGTVLDGRDIGTVICPDADVKLFVTASLAVRSMRRQKELRSLRKQVSALEMMDQLRSRDQLDSSRNAAPMKISEDAHLIDTTELSIEAAINQAINVIDKV